MSATREGTGAKAKMATTMAAEEVPKSVVTNPVMARQIRGLFVSVLIPLLFRRTFDCCLFSHIYSVYILTHTS